MYLKLDLMTHTHIKTYFEHFIKYAGWILIKTTNATQIKKCIKFMLFKNNHFIIIHNAKCK